MIYKAEFSSRAFYDNPVKCITDAVLELEYETGMSILDSDLKDFYERITPDKSNLNQSILELIEHHSYNGKMALAYKAGKLVFV